MQRSLGHHPDASAATSHPTDEPGTDAIRSPFTLRSDGPLGAPPRTPYAPAVPARLAPQLQRTGAAPDRSSTAPGSGDRDIGWEAPAAANLDELGHRGACVAALPWSRRHLDDLGVTTDLLTAAKILRIGRTSAYALARAGEFPVPVVRIGRKYVVAVAHLVDLLQLGERAS